ncbi:MAG: hypothetical protein HC856_05790 [Pseudanabaena sp. RU_4_16]|nr:hypothetical protein [Pseudanabaena sp. RU_4_16]
MTDTNDPSTNIEQAQQTESEGALVLPTVETTILPIQMPMIPPLAFEALAKKDPAGLLSFVKSYDERRYQIANLKEENRHKESISREETKSKERDASNKTNRIAMGLVFAFLAIVLLYSGLTGNKELPEKVINITAGALGGAGGATLLKRKEDK